MAVYATRDDLNSLGLPPEVLARTSGSRQDAALALASSRADGYLASRYTLPLTSWDTSLTWAVCAIASYELLIFEGFNPEGADAEIPRRAREATRWLEQVGDGTITPVVVDATPLVAGAGPTVYTRPKRGW